MIEIAGKSVFTELAELVRPAYTALIMVDMQCDFIESEGAFGRMGIDLTMYAASRPRLASTSAQSRRRKSRCQSWPRSRWSDGAGNGCPATTPRSSPLKRQCSLRVNAIRDRLVRRATP